jgi:acylphosphatase
MARIRTRVLVSGRVQGVWFRGSTQDRARELGLSGWARNLVDGRVEAVFEGEEEAVRAALSYVREGPPHARVSDVEVHDEPPMGESGEFRIRRD